MTERGELTTQRREVVDLTVECEHHRRIVVGHRLVRGARQVNDAQPRMAEADSLFEPRSPVVRPSMRHTLAHAFELGAPNRRSAEAQDAADSTHQTGPCSRPDLSSPRKRAIRTPRAL